MKITKCIFIVLLTMLVNSASYAQEKQEWEKPKSTERVIGTININKDGGSYVSRGTGWNGDIVEEDNRTVYTNVELYNFLKQKVEEQYAEKYPNYRIRDFDIEQTSSNFSGGTRPYFYSGIAYKYKVSATVVVPDYQRQITEGFSKAMDKGFRNVREGSRIAIDIVTVASGIDMDRSTVKDMIVDVLLDKDYKVVAKEYLEKLLKEQQEQQSGIYNDNTTVRDNNFSAVGYYINVKVTETSLRLQVINVSTGEYEGNVTINF